MSTLLNSACNCCSDKFIIPFPVYLEGRSGTRSLSKCGFEGNPLDNNGEEGKIYLKRTFTYEDALGQQSFKIDCDGNISDWEGHPPIQKTFTTEFDPTLDSAPYCRETCEGFSPESGGAEEVQTVENEYTDEMLLENMQSLPVPEFSEWNNSVSPTAESTVDGFNAVETVAEYRITHPPSATAYLKVWIWSITRNSVEEDPSIPPVIDSSFDTYVWEGEPLDLNSGVGSISNRIYGNSNSLEVSEVNKKTNLYFAKWSIIDGYEPDDPIVTMEFDEFLGWVINFSRPDPDCNSNIMPKIFDPTDQITNVGQIIYDTNIKSDCFA